MSRSSRHRRRDGHARVWVGGGRQGDRLYASNIILGMLAVMLLALLVMYGLTLAATFRGWPEFL